MISLLSITNNYMRSTMTTDKNKPWERSTLKWNVSKFFAGLDGKGVEYKTELQMGPDGSNEFYIRVVFRGLQSDIEALCESCNKNLKTTTLSAIAGENYGNRKKK